MATSPVSICSNALVLLGGEPISSFTDGSTGSLLAANLYEETYHSLLSETLWHFATRTEDLARLAQEPTNGWKYKYQLPSDCLYVVKASSQYYEIYERELYSNHPTVQIEMIYPVDEVNLPMIFVKTLEYKLASIFAIPLTGNASRGDFYNTMFEKELMKAKRADASQRPANQIGGNERLLAVRYT